MFYADSGNKNIFTSSSKYSIWFIASFFWNEKKTFCGKIINVFFTMWMQRITTIATKVCSYLFSVCCLGQFQKKHLFQPSVIRMPSINSSKNYNGVHTCSENFQIHFEVWIMWICSQMSLHVLLNVWLILHSELFRCAFFTKLIHNNSFLWWKFKL